jgi:type I restriction enzyme, R subunit
VVPPEEEGETPYPEPGAGSDFPDLGEEAGARPSKYYVKDVEVRVATERVQYLDANGKLITESLKAFSRNKVRETYSSLDQFLNAWSQADKKQALLEELASRGVFLEELAEQVGRDYDAFDLICHVAFDQPPLTRRERAEKVKKRNVFAKYGSKARAVLEALLQKYADTGIKSVESLEILKVDPLTTFGTPLEIIGYFGGKSAYLDAIHEIESALYPKAA